MDTMDQVSRGPKCRLLLASYPRTGSTALHSVLAELLGGSPVIVHEPFRTQFAPNQLHFDEGIEHVVEYADIVKHHPGNLLSDRQNRLLYERWSESGGHIIHLRRRDTLAQARSLVVARGLNSYHRPHRVGSVPEERLRLEHEQLVSEIDQQSRIIEEFAPIDVDYEDLFTGTLDDRIARLESFLTELDPSLVERLAVPSVNEKVRGILDPERQVRRRDHEDADASLIDQAPRFAGALRLLPFDAADSLARLIRSGLETRDPGRRYGLTDAPLVELVGATAADDLVAAIREAIDEHTPLRLDSSVAPVHLHAARYDGDRWPDHDLDLWPDHFADSHTMLQFNLQLGDPEQYDGGAIHLSGRGRQADSLGSGQLSWFASGIGARREPVTNGVLHTIVGALELAPGLVLAAGQFLGDDGLFV